MCLQKSITAFFFFPESDMFQHFSAIVIYSYELYRETAISYKGTYAANTGMFRFWLASGRIDMDMDTKMRTNPSVIQYESKPAELLF